MTVMTARQLVSSTVKAVTEGVIVTIFIVVTHLVRFESRGVNGFFCDADVLSTGLLEARRVDSGTTDTNFFTERGLLETRRVDSCTTDTNFFAVGRLLQAWCVNSGTGNTGFLAIGWLGSGRVYGCLVDSDFFTVSGLELGSVLTFSEVELSFVFVTTVVRKVDGDISVVASAAWKIDVDVGFGVLVFGSSFFADVNIFSAARTVVTILFTSYMDLFLSVLAGGGTRRKVGGDRRVVFTFPSDALVVFVGKIDLTLDVSLLGGLLFFGDVSIRRRKNAEGDRNAGVKIQCADL